MRQRLNTVDGQHWAIIQGSKPRTVCAVLVDELATVLGATVRTCAAEAADGAREMIAHRLSIAGEDKGKLQERIVQELRPAI